MKADRRISKWAKKNNKMLRVWKNITNSELEKLRKEAIKEKKNSVGLPGGPGVKIPHF